MEVALNKCQFTSEDIIRELNSVTKDGDRYFDLMYKTLQFSFAAIIAIVGFGFGFFDSKQTINEYSFIFSFVLPVCMYVFGIMYAYNAYALAVLGKKAEYLHSMLYQERQSKDKVFEKMMKQYVMTNRVTTLLAYGVPLGFYIVIPAVSICFSCKMFTGTGELFLYHILPVLCLWIYYMLMCFLIIEIKKNHFEVTELQKTHLNCE